MVSGEHVIISGEVHIMMILYEDTSGEVRMFRAHT